MGSWVTFAGLTEMRAKVARLAEALQRAAGGEVVERAAAKVADRVNRIALDKLGGHVASGHALDALEVTISGPLVKISAPAYLRLHSFWPFRRGMPASVAKYASEVLAAELLGVLGEERSSFAAQLADSIVAGVEAGMAKKRAKEEAAYERRTRRREDRE